MDIFDLLTMVGGLALFLYGMNLMGAGLSQASEGKLKYFLRKWTNTPGKAVLMGAGVTALIQSSSAVTVMTAGLVNGGVMELEQAAGIIMGANIGTTVTAWILGMAGINSSAVLVRMLKPASFSPVLAMAGVMLLLYSGKERIKNISSVLVGFAILIFGMDTMCGAVKPLTETAGFAECLVRFSHPVCGVFAGMVSTAILQSSSASVGILQAFCATGAVSYGIAIPVILGQNIGTCATAMLAGLGSGRDAKRAAWIHFYFNVIGTALSLAGVYGLNAVRPFRFLSEAADRFGIACVHSVFNVCTALLLLPFNDALARLARCTVRETAHPHLPPAGALPSRGKAASSALWRCDSE